MHKWWYGCALVGVAILSSALTAALLPPRQVVVVAGAAKAAEVAKPRPGRRTVRLPHLTGHWPHLIPPPAREQPQ